MIKKSVRPIMPVTRDAIGNGENRDCVVIAESGGRRLDIQNVESAVYQRRRAQVGLMQRKLSKNISRTSKLNAGKKVSVPIVVEN